MSSLALKLIHAQASSLEREAKRLKTEANQSRDWGVAQFFLKQSQKMQARASALLEEIGQF